MSMNSSVSEEVEVKSSESEAELLLDVRAVSKIYHLWESPRARLIYGLWSQVPAWAPRPLRTTAETQKAKLGRNFYALRDVSLDLHRGESIAILGRNGSGKSTLLQLICGTLRPSEGTVSRHCHRVAALLELGSGFNPEFTGRENVYLNGAVLGLAKDEVDAKFDQILEFAEIDQFIDQPVKTYSSGMMVRLAFAVQVQLDPELLIVDEALSVGDVFFQQKCFAHMRRLKERGCSFLIVSHDTVAIQQFCDRGTASLIRWSCTDESGKTADQFFENQKIRLFAEFECTVPVHEASPGLAIRDRTGQLIHAKHLYQMRPDTKIGADAPFFLLCEFSFVCRLTPGEYTVEFGLVDISSAPDESGVGSRDTPIDESSSNLYWGRPVGRFTVVPQRIDPIRRRGHFGMVDFEAESRFKLRRADSS